MTALMLQHLMLGAAVTASGLTTDPGITGTRSDGFSIDFASPPTMQPETAPRYLAVSRPGFNASGAAVNYTEGLILTQRMRQAYPNHASLDATRVSLHDYLYSTDIISGTPTNSSAEASPKPVANWANIDRRVIGNILPREYCEVVAFHRNARNREEVACVEYTVTDGTTTLGPFRQSVSEISRDIRDKAPVVVYMPPADIDVSSLITGVITVNAKVFPWIGTTASGSVRDSAAGTADSREFCPRTFRKDPTLYAAPYLINVATAGGNDTTATVSTDPATVDAGTAAATIKGAIERLRAQVPGNRIDGCIIRLQAGTHVISNVAANTYQDNAEVTITRHPTATKANAILSFGAAAWGTQCRWLRLKGISLLRTGTGTFTGPSAGSKLVFDDIAFDAGAQNQVLFGSNYHMYVEGMTVTNQAGSTMNSAAAGEWRLLRGLEYGAVNLGASSLPIEPWLVLGCKLSGVRGSVIGGRTQTGSIMAYNRMFGLGYTSAVFSLGGAENIDGAAIVQNLFEYTHTGATILWSFSPDAATGNITHLICHHNAVTGFLNGGRVNGLYVDTAGTGSRVHKLCSFKGNIWCQLNTKHDVFATTAGNVGGWAYLYGVGCEGEFSQFIDASSGGIGSAFAQAYPGLRASIGTSNSIRNDPTFSEYAGTTSGPTLGTANGVYTIDPGSTALARVASPVLRFDLYGNERASSNDASGACAPPVQDIYAPSFLKHPAYVAGKMGKEVLHAMRYSMGLRTPTTKVAGVDAPPTGWSVIANLGMCTTANNPSPLEGYNMAGIPIVVRHTNAWVINCTPGNNGSYSSTQGCDIRLGNSSTQDISGFKVLNCGFDGGGNSTTDGRGVAIFQTYTTMTGFANGEISGNSFKGYAGDPIDVKATNARIFRNYIGPCGFKPSALISRIWPHLDVITFFQTGTGGTSYIYENFIWQPYSNGQFGKTTYLNVGSGNTEEINFEDNLCYGWGSWGSYPGDSEANSNAASFQLIANNGSANVNINRNALDRRSSAYNYMKSGTANSFIGNYQWSNAQLASLPNLPL